MSSIVWGKKVQNLFSCFFDNQLSKKPKTAIKVPTLDTQNDFLNCKINIHHIWRTKNKATPSPKFNSRWSLPETIQLFT